MSGCLSLRMQYLSRVKFRGKNLAKLNVQGNTDIGVQRRGNIAGFAGPRRSACDAGDTLNKDTLLTNQANDNQELTQR